MKLRRSFLILTMVVTWLPSAFAAQWWVDAAAEPGGGGTKERPFRTISTALDAMDSGDEVVVRGGTYRETLSWSTGGTGKNPSTLRAAAYRLGDFDGDGKTDIPKMAADLETAKPSANDPIVLLTLPRREG